MVDIGLEGEVIGWAHRVPSVRPYPTGAGLNKGLCLWPCGMEARSRSPRGARPRYVGRCPCLVNEDELVRIEANLAPFFSPLQDVRPLLLGGVCGLFLSVILRRWKKRDNAEMLNVCPSSASAAFSSSNVLSGSTAISARFDRLRASIAALWLRCHLAGRAVAGGPSPRRFRGGHQGSQSRGAGGPVAALRHRS